MSLLRPRPQISQSFSVPAPMLGINAVDGLAEMGPKDAIYAYNLYPGQYGLRVRSGYVQWATNVGAENGGRTVMAFKGSTSGEDALFTTSKSGIYDITASVDSPVAAYSFGTADGTSGYGQWTNFTVAGGHYLIYCDETNGYLYYSETAGTWTLVGGAITGATAGDFVACCIHKERLWFVERDTANAWYLPVGQITGAVSKFNFGALFRHGGYLVNLYSWTVDGGNGVDDYLVAISSSGDVVVFKGTDPTLATDWFQQGSWFIGEPPAGRRVAGSFGGELYLLSSYGVLPISKLVSGVLIQKEDEAISTRITPVIQAQIATLGDNLGWEIQQIPSSQLILVSVPLTEGGTDLQVVQSLNLKSWTLFRDLPYFTGAEWNKDLYFSDGAGTVYIYTGTVDAVALDGSGGEEIEFSLLTSFQQLGPPGHTIRVQFLRPWFIAAGIPGYDIAARYDYNLAENDPVVSGSVISGALWDAALWDIAVWGGGTTVTSKTSGGAGMGKVVAVALRGKTSIDTTLIKFEGSADAGNFL